MNKKKVYCKNCKFFRRNSLSEIFITVVCAIIKMRFDYVEGKQIEKKYIYNPYKKNEKGTCKDYKKVIETGLQDIEINPDWMGHIEKGARITKPLMIFCGIIYILVTIFALNNLINYFN